MEDKQLICTTCGTDFSFTGEEQDFTSPKGSRNPKSASLAGMLLNRPVAAVDAVAAATAADAVVVAAATAALLVSCTMRYVPDAACKPRCRSSQKAPSQCIAAIASRQAAHTTRTQHLILLKGRELWFSPFDLCRTATL